MMIVLLAELVSMSVLFEAISEGDIYKIDPDVCTDCGACSDVCPVEAIHLHSVTIYEMIRDMPWYVLFYFYWGLYLAFPVYPGHLYF